MSLTAARQVADAVLYEGYLLYPYRASSSKNVVRWQFGVLGPEGAAAAGVGEPPSMTAEVLLDVTGGGPVEATVEATIEVHLRFLQVQARTVERLLDGQWEEVAELRVGGTTWIPFSEAAPREVHLSGLSPTPQSHPVRMPGGTDVEELREHGQVVGRLVRRRWPLAGTLTLRPRPGVDPHLLVLQLRVDNTTAWSPGVVEGWSDRDVAARHSFVGTNLLATTRGARFVSLLDGPDWSEQDARSCRQERCWPVLVADDDGADALLVAPIVLGDHPSIAPESAGDLFDATEIDEILTLRVMTMTEQEKAEARGTDPRAAAILARCDTMSDDVMAGLHGARRPAGRGAVDDGVVEGSGAGESAALDEVPWWDADQDARAAPETDEVLVGGVPVSQGSRVLLRPSRRADAQDLFLAGMTAVVSRVYGDVDGGWHVAVMLEDDPGSDLYGATGRYYYFGPEELEALPTREDAR